MFLNACYFRIEWRPVCLHVILTQVVMRTNPGSASLFNLDYESVNYIVSRWTQ